MDQARSIAIGAGITGAIGIVVAGLRYAVPWLVRKVHRSVGEIEFAEELKRGRETHEAVQRIEPALEKMARDIGDIRDILRAFAQQLGQVQGVKAGDLPSVLDQIRERTS